MTSETTSPVASCHLWSRSSSATMLRSCFNNRTSPFVKLSIPSAIGGPGDQPGMARKAAAGPMDAGSDAVATTSTTISDSYSDSSPSPNAARLLRRLPSRGLDLS
uniref:Uncharacterized protein n=1 Tax=Arundo donax TaxID=35708 RepID=A0A0A9FTW2_ARUDO